LSFVPIAGELLDLLTLFTDPTIWGKAMSLIGLVASLLSDGAEILTAVGIVVPPALAALPAAVGAEAVDVGAAILKNVRRLVSADVFGIIKNIPFDEALQLGGDVLGQLAKRAVTEIGGASNWPGSIDEVFSLIQNVLGSVWEPFVALVKHYGTAGLGKLFTLGFGEGGFLAGRVLRQGGEFNDVDKVVEGVAEIGDDLLAEGAADLSDDATKFLGEMVDDAGKNNTRVLLEGITCPAGITQVTYRKMLGLASPLFATAADRCLEALANITPGNAQDGFKKLMGTTEADAQEALKVWNKYQSHPARDHLFEVLNEISTLNKAEFAKRLELVGGIDKTDTLKKLWNLIPPEQPHRLNKLVDYVKGVPNPGDMFDFLADFALSLERKPVPLLSSLPQPSNLYSRFSYARMDHFLEGHTYKYLRPDQRLNKPTTLWPKTITPEEINRYLQQTLDDLAAKGDLPDLANPRKKTVVFGVEVQIGIENDGAGGVRIGQFFPIRDITGKTTLTKIEAVQMKAIWEIFK